MSQSIFSRIAAREVDAHVIFETERVMGILDIAPASDGHTVLFPKEPFQVLAQVPDDVLVDLFLALRIVRHATLVQDPTVEGLTSFIAQGGAAGQRAPHLLIHTVPRRDGDDLFSAPTSPSGAFEHAMFERSDGLLVEPCDPARSQGEIRIVDSRADVFEELEPSRIGVFSAAIREVSSALFETFEAQGTNVFIESGSSQDRLGALAYVLARSDDDGLSFDWQPIDSDLRVVSDRFSTAFSRLAGKRSEQKNSQKERVERPVNYLLRQLERLP